MRLQNPDAPVPTGLLCLWPTGGRRSIPSPADPVLKSVWHLHRKRVPATTVPGVQEDQLIMSSSTQMNKSLATGLTEALNPIIELYMELKANNLT